MPKTTDLRRWTSIEAAEQPEKTEWHCTTGVENDVTMLCGLTIAGCPTVSKNRPVEVHEREEICHECAVLLIDEYEATNVPAIVAGQHGYIVEAATLDTAVDVLTDGSWQRWTHCTCDRCTAVRDLAVVTRRFSLSDKPEGIHGPGERSTS